MTYFRIKVRAVDVSWNTLTDAARFSLKGAGVLRQDDGLYTVIYTTAVAADGWWRLPEGLDEGSVRDIWIDAAPVA
jgi:hypothetical protein